MSNRAPEPWKAFVAFDEQHVWGSPAPTCRGRLTPPTALAAIELAMQENAGTHGERWRSRPVMHHLLKGVGHAARAGVRGDALDEDGLPHLVLAATRLVLAVAVLIDGPSTTVGEDPARRP